MKGTLDKIAREVTTAVKHLLTTPEYDFSGVGLTIVYDESTSNDLNIRTKFNGRLSIDEQDLLQRVIADNVLRIASKYKEHPPYHPPVFKNGYMVFSTSPNKEPSMDTELHNCDVIRSIVKQYYKTSTLESIVDTLRDVFTHYAENILPKTVGPTGDIIKYNFDFNLTSDNVTFYGIFYKHVYLEKDKRTIRVVIDSETKGILETLANNIIRETLLFKYSINPVTKRLVSNVCMKVVDLVNASLEYLHPKTSELIRAIHSDPDQNTIIVLYKSGSYLDISIDVGDMPLNELSDRVLNAIVNNG